MKLHSVPILVALVGMSSALMGYDGALQTGYVALDPRGFSPRPTPAPFLNPHRRDQLQKRGWTDTCAYISGSAITCATPLVCAFNSQEGYMACCSTDTGGNLLNPCVMTTSCVDQVQSASICSITDSVCIGPMTAVCGQLAGYPECVAVVLVDGIYTYTTFRCGASAYTVVATPIENVITPTSSTSTTTVSTTTTTSSPSPSPSPTTTTTTIPTSSSTTTSFPSSTTTTFSSSSTSSITSSTSTSPISAVTSQASHSHTAAIAGGTAGGVVGILLIGGLIGFIAYRMRVKKREGEYADNAPEMSGSPFIAK